MIPSKIKVGTAYIRCCTTKLKRQKNINNEVIRNTTYTNWRVNFLHICVVSRSLFHSSMTNNNIYISDHKKGKLS